MKPSGVYFPAPMEGGGQRLVVAPAPVGGYVRKPDSLLEAIVRGWWDDPAATSARNNVLSTGRLPGGGWDFRWDAPAPPKNISVQFTLLKKFPKRYGRDDEEVRFGFDLSPAILRRTDEFAAGIHPKGRPITAEWMEASAEAAKNEPALSHPLVPQWVKVRLGERVFFSGLYTLTDEHFRTYYRHENAKNPRPVVDFRGPSSLTVRDFTTGEPLETGELISEGKRVYLLQKARRKQREAIAEIAGLGVGWMYSVARYMEEVIPGSPTVRTPLGVTNGEQTSENSSSTKFMNKGKKRGPRQLHPDPSYGSTNLP